MRRRRLPMHLLQHQGGGTAVEFAIVAPVLAFLIVGLIQVGTLFHAHASMRASLSEGARMATLYRPPATPAGWAGPTAAEICGRVTGSVAPLGNADITALTLERTTNGTANALNLAMSYNVDLDFILFSQSPTLTASRRVYVRTQPSFGSPAFACTIGSI
jgi:Flp pilus assembly protein TadG